VVCHSPKKKVFALLVSACGRFLWPADFQVFGSTTPYVYAFEHLRQRRLDGRRANPADDDDDDAREPGEQLQGAAAVDALLWRARRCATAPRRQLSSARAAADEDAACLVLHVAAVVASVGAAVGLEAAQALLLPRVVAFLDAAAQHPPALLLPLLRQASSAGHAHVSTAGPRPADAFATAGGESSRPTPVGLWAAVCSACGWASVALHLVPQALRWLDPASTARDVTARGHLLPPVRPADSQPESGPAAESEEEPFETTSPHDLLRASAEVRRGALSLMVCRLFFARSLGLSKD
jgi:hypothetical protein